MGDIMEKGYLIGLSLAILSGVLNQFGQLLQKKAVNNLPEAVRQTKFMRTLLKNPLWIAGFILSIGCGTACFMVAQDYIGPALVPGLMASGLIVLAIGSVWMNGESLDSFEIIGIFLMIAGIALLGLSGLSISGDVVIASIAKSSTVARITIFSLTIVALWIIIHFISLRSGSRKGIVMGVSNGFPFALSNFWISPLVAVIFMVMGGRGSTGQMIIFIIASVVLVSSNVIGMWQTQECFRYGQASNIIPVQQVPVQIAPVLVYFYVFALKAPSSASVAYMLSGVALIIISGFLLGRRQEEASVPSNSVLEAGE
jgi:drug/metabolite transporter (DMT)-like permease